MRPTTPIARRRGERVFLPHLYRKYNIPKSAHKAMAAQVNRLDSSEKDFYFTTMTNIEGNYSIEND
jgi:hypothetical protein